MLASSQFFSVHMHWHLLFARNMCGFGRFEYPRTQLWSGGEETNKKRSETEFSDGCHRLIELCM